MIERVSPTGKITGQRNVGKCFNIFTTHLSAKRMAAANSDPPFVKVTIIAHRNKSGLDMLAGFFGQFKIGSIREGDKLSDSGQYAGCIAGIETSVMKSRSIYFNSANRPRSIAQ